MDDQASRADCSAPVPAARSPRRSSRPRRRNPWRPCRSRGTRTSPPWCSPGDSTWRVRSLWCAIVRGSSARFRRAGRCRHGWRDWRYRSASPRYRPNPGAASSPGRSDPCTDDAALRACRSGSRMASRCVGLEWNWEFCVNFCCLRYFFAVSLVEN